MDFSQIKLVVWDLDDTFWKGTLSEGGVEPIDSNIQLVKTLTDCGIVNTICSKNDLKPVLDKLTELGVSDYFVFNSVDWTPKGPRISALLKDMGLRADNTLFVDDNIVNLNEAKHYEANLMIAEPTILPQLTEYISLVSPNDKAHKRLNNYKVLEKKRESRNSYSDNESFLYASNTRVSVHHDCIEKIDRIYELVMRTNQLNYTKKRSSREDLLALLQNPEVKSGYVTVKDAFGDYGIVGFYAIQNGKCEHFLFSCRTIGQGVEQYVYATLGHPELRVEGVVINEVTNAPAPGWINQDIEYGEHITSTNRAKGKIVFKGPCDLMGLTSYLKAENVICELTYISDTRHNNLEHQGCMTNFLQIPDLTKDDIDCLVNDCIFNDEGMFKTALYDRDVKLIFISSLQEFHFGIYKNKNRNLRIAFGEWNHPLTDKNEWDGYINDTVWTSSNKFTKEFLSRFSDEWEFEGRKPYDAYISEIEAFMKKIAKDAQVCVFLGSEIAYEGKTTEAWANRHLVHAEINKRLRALAQREPRLHLIDYTELITSQKDYTDSIDHMQRHIHYKAAEKANDVIRTVLGREIKQSSRLKVFANQCRDVVTNIHVAYINFRKKK